MVIPLSAVQHRYVLHQPQGEGGELKTIMLPTLEADGLGMALAVRAEEDLATEVPWMCHPPDYDGLRTPRSGSVPWNDELAACCKGWSFCSANTGYPTAVSSSFTLVCCSLSRRGLLLTFVQGRGFAGHRDVCCHLISALPLLREQNSQTTAACTHPNMGYDTQASHGCEERHPHHTQMGASPPHHRI